MLERFYLIKNVLITLRFLTLCASVGNKRGFSTPMFSDGVGTPAIMKNTSWFYSVSKQSVDKYVD